MKIKALIQSHYPERVNNLSLIRESLLKNGLKSEDIIFLIDYQSTAFLKSPAMVSEIPMPINWWHGVASVLDCDYVMLLCDDLCLKSKSIQNLIDYATICPDIEVFGYEGAVSAKTERPYQDSRTHTASEIEIVDFVIRFYFGKPQSFAKALNKYHELPKELRGHDDLILSLSNKCAIIPTTEDSGWLELPEYDVAYSHRPQHYNERDELIRHG